MNIQIYPLDKVVFDNVSICFGMEKSAVELALGIGEVAGNRCYYFNGEMAIAPAGARALAARAAVIAERGRREQRERKKFIAYRVRELSNSSNVNIS